jgi:cyclase
MIKKRIIPTLTYQDRGLVKSTGFSQYRFIGDPIQAIRVYNLRDVDELLFIDISQTNDRPNIPLIKEIMQYAFMPITIGGGIKSLDDIKALLDSGADKICLSTISIDDINFVEEAIKHFGGQAIVLAIDYIYQDGIPKLVTNPGFKIHEKELFSYIQQLSSMGISEFVVTAVDHDGTMKGYDIPFINQLETITSAGIIINGGAGNPDDMLKAFQQTNAVGVAAASIFQFTEHTPIGVRKHLKANGIKTRE